MTTQVYRSFPRRGVEPSAWECLNGRSASALWDAERPGLHSHALRGNDQRLN